MSVNTAGGKILLPVLTTDQPAAAKQPNTAVISAIKAHHAQLSDDLRAKTSALLRAADSPSWQDELTDLHEWYRDELIPHAVAEEKTLYSLAGGLAATALLIRGMLDEHRALVSLVADLALTRDALSAALIAASAQTLFASHLGKENDLLLPALDDAGVDLDAVLHGMHEILGGHAANVAGGHAANVAGGHAANVAGGHAANVARGHAANVARGHAANVARGHAANVAGGHAANSDSDSDSGCGCGCGHDAGASSEGAAVMTADDELDVRTLPHGARHEIIFAKLDALQPGEALVIVNDHDPKPLRYQTSALWPDRFEWTYREAGPAVWRVAITRAG
jgi:uncharacterized protein (DUF2249 family)